MKKNLILLMLLLGAFLFVGCQKNVRKPNDFNVLSIEDIKNSSEKIVVEFQVRSGVVSTALVDLEAEFEARYPYIDIKVKGITGSYDDLRSTTFLDINTKKAPDLIMGYPDHFAEYYAGAALVNLQYFINDDEVGYTKKEMADFLESYLGENKGYDEAYPNDLYGLPFNKSTEVLVYNKTFFEGIFGANYLDKIPETWDEVVTVSQEILNKVRAGAADQLFVESIDTEKQVTTYLKVSDYLKEGSKFIPFSYDSSDNAFITLTRQFGGNYTERVNVQSGYIRFDNAESRAAMTYFRNNVTNGLFGNAAIFGANYASDAFKLIQCVMTVGSTAGVNYNSSDKYDYELGVAPIPYYTEEKKLVIQQGTNIGMLNQNSDEEKLAAWLFIKFLMEPEKTAQFAMATGGYLPVRHSAYETDAYKNYLTNPSDDKVAYSRAANIALNTYIEKGYTFFVDDAFVGSSKIRKEAGALFDSIMVLGKEIDAQYKEAYKTLNPYVQK